MKKAIKIAASTAVAASAFVAAAPAQQADAAVNVNQLVSDAQNAGTVLKWAISVEGSADFVSQPFTQYNAAKKAIAAAEAAAKKLSVSEKLAVDAKLVDAKIQVTRAGYYIDAITSSNKIKELTATLDAAIASGDIAKVEAAYHKATAEYRKQAKLLDRVYGQTTRDEIRNAVKPALEKSVASVKNEVTVSMLVAGALADNKAGKFAEAHAKIAEAQAILDANELKWETALTASVEDAKKALSPIPGNITVTKAEFHGEAGQTHAVVVTVKDSKGKAYNGPATLSFDNTNTELGAGSVAPAGYVISTVNGVATGGVTTHNVDVVNGQVVLTVTTTNNAGVFDAVAGGTVKVETFPEGYGEAKADTTTSGSLNFYKKVKTADFGTGQEVFFVDAANNYFVTNDLNKYVLSAAGNVYLDTVNSIITLDAFKAKLTAGDIVTGNYYSDGGSTLKLLVDKVAQTEFKLALKAVTGTDAYRVLGNNVTLSGSGEAGKLVNIYKGSTLLTQVQIGSNGQWSLPVGVTTADTLFTVHQASANLPALAYSAVADLVTAKDPSVKTVVVTPGKFEANGTAGSGTLLGQTVMFTAPLDDNEKAVVATNAQITLVDFDLTKATFTNGVNGTVIKAVNGGFTIKFGNPAGVTAPQGGNHVLDGSLTIQSVTGIQNAYKMNVNVSGFLN
jgi:hypothetical protein